MKRDKVIAIFIIFIVMSLMIFENVNLISCIYRSDCFKLSQEVFDLSPKNGIKTSSEGINVDETTRKDVLVIYSYEPNYKWIEGIRNGIESVLLSDKKYVHVYSEYMDTKRIYDRDYFNRIYSLYKYKYNGYKFDAIISCDNEAMEFLKLYGEEIFSNTPIVFCGINKREDFKLDMPNTYLVKENVNLKDNLELIQKLHPKLNNITVLVDKTITGNELKKNFNESIENMNFKWNIKIIEDKNIYSTIREINNIGKDNVIFYLAPTFYEDEGVTSKISIIEALEIIRNKTSVPIYSAWDIYLGKGIVGGNLISAWDQGKIAADIVDKLLLGENLKDYKINYPMYQYSFDYEQLTRFEIKKSQLPIESIIINKPTQGFVISEKSVKLGIICSIIFLIFVICIMLSINYRLKKTEKRLKNLLALRDSMLEINQKIINMEEIKELYDLILEKALEAIKGDNIGSILILKKDGYLHMEAYRGFKKEDISNFKINPEKSFLWIKSKGKMDKSMIINDLDKFPGAKFLDVEEGGDGKYIKSNITAPIFVNGKFHGMLNIDSKKNYAFNEDDLMDLNYLKNQIEVAINKHNMYEKIKSLSRHDKLTNIFNRGYFEELCKKYVDSKKDNLSIVMFDINCLKVINDTLGHLAGDTVIKTFSKGLKDMLKDKGFAGRVGGDEFSGIFFNIGEKEVEDDIKKLIKFFKENPICFEGVEIVCSFSYGIAIFPKEAETYNELVKLADKRMYENKKECKLIPKRSKDNNC